MKFDQYEIKARIIPAVITTMLPLFLFNYFLVNPGLQKLFSALSDWKIVSGVTTSLILLYFIVEINRSLSKFLFERYYFEGNEKLPTTLFLLFQNTTFSDDFKTRIRSKIENDFQIKLLGKNEEESNHSLAVKLISEAVAKIRNKMRGDSFIKQANIRYGLFRNLVGGCVIGLLLSAANVAYLHYSDAANWALILNILLGGFYLLSLLLSKWLMRSHGESYAKTLLENYDYS